MTHSFIRTAQIILTIILTFWMIDFIFFCMWVFSNQNPVGDFYLGSLTAHTLKVLIGA